MSDYDRLNNQCIYCTHSTYHPDTQEFTCWIKDHTCTYPLECIDFWRSNDLTISREYYNIIHKPSRLISHEDDISLRFHIDFFKPIDDGVKIATTRLKKHDLRKDYVITGVFTGVDGNPTNNKLALRIVSVEGVLFKDLTLEHAENEGYKHVNLLKHELKQIYPNIMPSDTCQIINFRRMKIE